MIPHYLRYPVPLSEWWDETAGGRMGKYWAAREMAREIMDRDSELSPDPDFIPAIFLIRTTHKNYFAQILKKEWFR